MSNNAQATTQRQFVIVERNEQPFAIVKLARKPVNSLNTQLVTELYQVIEELEKDKTCRGFILTSAIPNIFCAGFDIMEMYDTTHERYIHYWTSVCKMCRKLYTTRLITIAAISGACPAAGTVLSMSCDYRIMLKGGYKIGLNETLLGIVAPTWFIDMFAGIIGQRQAELHLQLGNMLSVEEAVSLGLIDEVADSVDDLMQRSKREIKKWIKVPEDNARAATKLAIRLPLIQRAKDPRQEAEENWKFLSQPAVQKALAVYIQKLRGAKPAAQKKQNDFQQSKL